MLKKLYIHNFKSFYHSSFEFGKLNCLIAPNNSGKSNLVEALELINDLLFNKNDKKIIFKELRNFRHNEKNIILKPEFEVENYVLETNELIKYSCEINFNIVAGDMNDIDLEIQGYIKSIQIKEDDKVQDWFSWSQFRAYGEELNITLVNYAKHKKILDKKRYSKFSFKYNLSTLKYEINAEKILKNSVFNLIGIELDNKEKLIKPIKFKNLFTNMQVFESHYFQSHIIKEKQLFTESNKLNKDGSNLVSFINKLSSEIIEELSASLIGEVEQVDGIEIVEEAYTTLYFVENSKYKVPLNKTSDGTVHFIAIMSALIGNKNSMTLIIEEPERHMHMKVLSTILNTMRDSNKQIFFTTHSTEVLQQLELDEILFIFRDYYGDTKGQRAKDIPNIKKIMELFEGNLVEMIQTGVLGEYDE